MAFNPFFYWDSPLPLELIQKALEDLKDITPTVEQLKSQVDKLISDLDGAVQEEVQRVINQMFDDGDFAQIIGDLIANQLKNKTGDFDLSHMGYVLHKAHSYGVEDLPAADANLTYQEEFYSALQGNVAFEINGNMFWACCYVCQNGWSLAQNNNAARLYVYTINQDGSLSYVTDKEFAAVGHCNAMCYHKGYLYITPDSYAGTGGGLTTDILRVSFDGSTLGGTPAGDNKYTMERKTPVGWEYTEDIFSEYICSDGEQLYVCDGRMNFYKYDWYTNEVTLEIARINGSRGRSDLGDGFCIDNDFIYMGASAHRIKRFNRKLGYIDWVYQLPIKANNKCFKLGEVEGITVIDGVLYLASFYNLTGLHTAYNTYSITHFYRQNLATNDISVPTIIDWSNGYALEVGNFYISGDLPSDTRGSYSDYFTVPCIQVALDFLETNDFLTRGTISVRQYRNLSTIDIRTTKPVTIDGEYYMNSSGGTRPSIGHIHCRSNGCVILRNLIFDNRLPSDLPVGNVLDNCIFMYGGELCVFNCIFPGGLVTNASTVKYCIKIYNAVIIDRIQGDDITTPDGWTDTRSQNGVSDTSYIAGTSIVENVWVNGTITFRAR